TGATLPYLAGRLDICHRFIPEARAGGVTRPPSEYLKRLYYDTVTFDQESLRLAYALAGPRQLLYGSDYPHVIRDMQGGAARAPPPRLRGAERERSGSASARRIFRL